MSPKVKTTDERTCPAWPKPFITKSIYSTIHVRNNWIVTIRGIGQDRTDWDGLGRIGRIEKLDGQAK